MGHSASALLSPVTGSGLVLPHRGAGCGARLRSQRSGERCRRSAPTPPGEIAPLPFGPRCWAWQTRRCQHRQMLCQLRCRQSRRCLSGRRASAASWGAQRSLRLAAASSRSSRVAQRSWVLSLKRILVLTDVLLSLPHWRTPCVGFGVRVGVAGWLASASAQRAPQLLSATPAGFLPWPLLLGADRGAAALTQHQRMVTLMQKRVRLATAALSQRKVQHQHEHEARHERD